MLATDSLPPDLQQLWDSKGEEQLAIVRLNLAASRGNIADLKVGALYLMSITGGRSILLMLLCSRIQRPSNITEAYTAAETEF